MNVVLFNEVLFNVFLYSEIIFAILGSIFLIVAIVFLVIIGNKIYRFAKNIEKISNEVKELLLDAKYKFEESNLIYKAIKNFLMKKE